MIGAKETGKFFEHFFHWLPKIPKLFEQIASKNAAVGLAVYSVLCNIVKANGTRVNVINFNGYNRGKGKEHAEGRT
jgi:hypothetical protein